MLSAKQLSEEIFQKEEAIKRWKQTISIWEASVQDHKKMEEVLKLTDVRQEK